MKTIADILSEHPFFQGFSKEDFAFIAGCGKNVVFKENEEIAKPNAPADEFYLIRDGHIVLSMELSAKKAFIYQTLGDGDILGFSWLIPPYQWNIHAKAQTPTRAVAINGKCLREKCEKEVSFGYKMMKHLLKAMVMQEDESRLHLLDVYGNNQ